jgi:hypothetical protein
MIGISHSSPKRIMEALNMKNLSRLEVPVNKKKNDLLVNKNNKKCHKSTKKLSSKGGFVYLKDLEANSRAEKALILNYGYMLNNEQTTSLFNNKVKESIK